MFTCIHYSPASKGTIYWNDFRPKALVLTLTFQQCSSTRVEQSLVLAWALYNAAVFPEEVFSANISSPTNKQSGECTCHHSDPLPLKCHHHSRAADHQSVNWSFQISVPSHVLPVPICHHSFSLLPSCAHQDRYFKKSKKSQRSQIIWLIKNKKPILVKFQLLPILSHWLIHKTVMKYQPYARRQILPSNRDIQLWYNMICKSWHMKVISEIRKDLQKKWRQEVKRKRKARNHSTGRLEYEYTDQAQGI